MEVNFIYSIGKGSFVTIRHNNLRDLTARILLEVCNDTEIKVKLVPLRGEDLTNRTGNRSNEARLGVRASWFWERGEQVFFQVYSTPTLANISTNRCNNVMLSMKMKRKEHTMKEYYK